MEILAVMGPGMAFLVMIGVLIVFIVGLLASGIVKIHIEVVDEDDEKQKTTEKIERNQRERMKKNNDKDSTREN